MATVYQRDIQKRHTILEFLIVIMQVGMINQTSFGVTTKEFLKFLENHNKWNHLNLKKP